MGKGIIVSEQGSGMYSIKVEYNIARLQKAKINIFNNLSSSFLDLLSAQNDLDNFLTEKDIAVDDLNFAIDQANAANPSNKDFAAAFNKILQEATAKINLINIDIVKASTLVASLELEAQTRNIERVRIEEALDKYEDAQPITAWCGDFTEGLAVDLEIETIELNDETNTPNNQPIIITPTGQFTDDDILTVLQAELVVLEDEKDVIEGDLAALRSQVIPDTVAIALKNDELKDKGIQINSKNQQIKEGGKTQIQPVMSSGSWAIMYNLISLPAFQKWLPRFRQGKISNIDGEVDTCTVSFTEEYEFSSIEGEVHFLGDKYSIFQTPSINDVPIEYMTCNAKAFAEGDAVIVSFVRDWETPTVIGFIDNPKECSIYMESGFLDVFGTGVCAEESYLPAIVNYSPTIVTYMASTTTPMQGSVAFGKTTFEGELLADGFESKAVGCTEKLDIITLPNDPCGGGEFTNGGYCSVAIIERKKIHQQMPASNFSGKLRMMVQAIYGTTRIDYLLDDPDNPTGLNIGGIIVKHGYASSFGLFTTSTFDYFLIEISPSSVKYHPVKVSPMAQLFVQKLNDPELSFSADDIKRIEAYILSTGTFDEGNTVEGGSIETEGSPWYFGWHWTWDGSEGDVCLTKVDEPAQEYKIAHYNIKISHSVESVNVGTPEEPIFEDQHSFTQAVGAKEQGAWWPQNEILNIIRPFPIENKMEVMVPVKNSDGVSKQDAVVTPITNVLVHLYRSMSGELIKCRYTQDIINDPGTETDPPAEIGCYDSTDPVWRSNRETFTGFNGTNKLVVGDTTINGVVKSLSAYSRLGNTSEAIPVDPTNVFATLANDNLDGLLRTFQMCTGGSVKSWLVNSPYFFQGPNFVTSEIGDEIFNSDGSSAGFVTWRLKQHSIRVKYLKRESSTSATDWATGMFLEIPYDNCSAVFYGTNDFKAEQSFTETTGDFALWTTWGYVSIMESTPASDQSPASLISVEGPEPTTNPGFASTLDLTSEVITNPESEENNIELHIFKEEADTDIHVATSDATHTYNGYFNIPYFLDNTLDAMDNSRESTSGEYLYSFATVNSETYEYNGTSSIGWA